MKSIKTKTVKFISFVLALALVAAMTAACGNAPAQAADRPAQAPEASAPEPVQDPPTGSASAPESGSGLSGDVTTAGSTSMQPLSDELAYAFSEIYPDVIVDVQGGGSGQGVTAVKEDLVDFGALSRELKDEERAIITQEFVIAKDGIAIVTNKNVDVDGLTIEQLKLIFTGEITNWSEVGGTAAKIEVVCREDGSGTRDAFNELTGVLGKDADGNNVDNTTETALIQNSTGAIMTTVAGTENAIGYVSLGSLNDSVKAMLVEGVEASAATVLDGSYKVSRPFIYITERDLSPQAQAFIDFIFSAEGQAIVVDSGFIAVA